MTSTAQPSTNRPPSNPPAGEREGDATTPLDAAAPALLAACRDRLPCTRSNTTFAEDLETIARTLASHGYHEAGRDLLGKAQQLRAAVASATGQPVPADAEFRLPFLPRPGEEPGRYYLLREAATGEAHDRAWLYDRTATLSNERRASQGDFLRWVPEEPLRVSVPVTPIDRREARYQNALLLLHGDSECGPGCPHCEEADAEADAEAETRVPASADASDDAMEVLL